jgi:AcrR family transcriptional regulator
MRWPRREPETADPERERIAAALVTLVAERGWRGTDLGRLLERAGVDAASFHRLHANLEDCFCTTYQELSTEFLIRAGAAFAGQDGWRDQIRRVAYELLDFLQEDPPRAAFLFIEVLFAGERAQLIRDQNMEALYAFIDLGRQELPDPGSETSELAAAIGGGIYNRMRLQIARHRDDPGAWDQFVPQLMYSVVEPYLGADAALEELNLPRPGAAALRR